MRRFQIIIVFLLCLATAYLLRCSQNVAGGGSESGNPVVIGIILNENGEAAYNTQVKLIPSNYNPVIDQQPPDSMIDTTDGKGCYSFILPNTSGVYNIEGTHLSQGTKLLITGIRVYGDTTAVQHGILKEPGAIKLFLPDTIDTAKGYIFIQGTTLIQSLSAVIPVSSGEYMLIVDSVPAVQIPGFHYDKLDNPFGPELLSDTIIVSSNDTTATEAFVFWVNFTMENSGLADNRVQDIYIAPDNTNWFSGISYGGLSVFDGVDWVVYTEANSGLPTDNVIEITQDNSGLFWFATFSGVVSFDGNQWNVYNPGNSMLPANEVTGIEFDSKGILWASTYGGAARYDGSQWEIYDTSNSGISADQLASITLENDTSVWFSSKGGLIHFDGNSWTTYTTSSSNILSNSIVNVFVDRFGTKWIGHYEGISKFDGISWTTFDSTNSTALKYKANTIDEDSKGNIWIGTDQGLTMYDGTNWHDFQGEKYTLLENRWIWSISFDADGNTWVGTTSEGVIAFGPTIK